MLRLSHLDEHRFNHNFNNCINTLCTFKLKVKPTVHFYLNCNFLNDLNSVDKTLLKLTDLSLISASFDDLQNALTLILRIKYRVNSEVLSGPLF